MRGVAGGAPASVLISTASQAERLLLRGPGRSITRPFRAELGSGSLLLGLPQTRHTNRKTVSYPCCCLSPLQATVPGKTVFVKIVLWVFLLFRECGFSHSALLCRTSVFSVD